MLSLPPPFPFLVIVLMFALGSLQSCSYLCRKHAQEIYLKGPKDNTGIIKITTPKQSFEVKDSERKNVWILRSVDDVPIKITCFDGTIREDMLETSYHWGVTTVGNILTAGIGFLVDYSHEQAYNIEARELDLAHYCK